jgi:competence protein ComEA
MGASPKVAAWRGYILVSLVWLAVLGAALFFARRPTLQPIEIVPPPTVRPASTTAPTAAADAAALPTPAALHIDVAGAVAAPGVYTLPADSRVADAILAAGGALADADLDRLNKAVALTDGSQVYVPRLAERGTPDMASAPTAGAKALTPRTTPAGTPAVISSVNINTATLEALDGLPGVGPATAQAIIAGRPYARIEDVLRVEGIGEAKFAKLQPYITVR